MTAVHSTEESWSQAELDLVRSQLTTLLGEVRSEIRGAASEMTEILDESSGDPVDTATRELNLRHDMQRAQNATAIQDQTERALIRLDTGSYGTCENCGHPIAKARLQAFPRAGSCVDCPT